MTTINRRALVTVAAALVPAPALGRPATHPDAELLGIGEQIKKLLPDYYKARQISHALYEQTEYATDACRSGDLAARGMGDGVPIFDRLGRWFTLICVGVAPSGPLVAAAAKHCMPLEVLQTDEPNLTEVYGSGLMLVRPDQHIAWRGGACEDFPAAEAIVACVLGWAPSKPGRCQPTSPPIQNDSGLP